MISWAFTSFALARLRFALGFGRTTVARAGVARVSAAAAAFGTVADLAIAPVRFGVVAELPNCEVDARAWGLLVEGPSPDPVLELAWAPRRGGGHGDGSGVGGLKSKLFAGARPLGVSVGNALASLFRFSCLLSWTMAAAASGVAVGGAGLSFLMNASQASPYSVRARAASPSGCLP